MLNHLNTVGKNNMISTNRFDSNLVSKSITPTLCHRMFQLNDETRLMHDTIVSWSDSLNVNPGTSHMLTRQNNTKQKKYQIARSN